MSAAQVTHATSLVIEAIELGGIDFVLTLCADACETPPITREQVRRLRTEAVEVGDDVMVEICDDALLNWSDQPLTRAERKAADSAPFECAYAIRTAEVQS